VNASREHGNVTLLMVAVIVFAGACSIGIARVGGAAAARARADTAADAAALAAADELALGHAPGVAIVAAQRAAAANGAALLECRCRDGVAEVAVERDGAHAAARAEITERAQLWTIGHDS
jgi:secretion/DNA translocation related TadE-like protein